MSSNGWTRLDRLMRYLHLYTGLFLIPWVAVYATSALCLNHRQWFVEHLGVTPPKWEVAREVDFVPDGAFPHSPEEQAKAILEYLELEGAHRIQGQPNPDRMVVFRISGSGHHRVTWRRGQSRIIVERQQPFSLFRLLHFLHFRGGYNQPYFAHVAWAVVVDAVSLSMWLWALSGVYIWARRRGKRLAGSLCLVVGCLLFAGLAILLCQ